MKLKLEDKARAHSLIDNPNETWLDHKGAWLTYVILVICIHLFLLSLPFLDTPTVWTLTTVIHNTIMYVLLHHLKGAPFETYDQGKSRIMTHWEQIDGGEMFTSTRKFLNLAPIILFVLASYYSQYNHTHFVINLLSLALGLIPKMPQLFGCRVLGINKY